MNIKKLWMMLAVASITICNVSCGGDDDENVVPPSNNTSNNTSNGSGTIADPEGTKTANVSNNEKTDIDLGIPYIYQDGYYMDGEGNLIDAYHSVTCNLTIDNSNNFYSIAYHYMTRGVIEYVSVGQVRGLAEIKTIPETGWSTKVAVMPNYGYVARRKNWNGKENTVTYARIFVVDWLDLSKSGAIIKYQTDWNLGK